MAALAVSLLGLAVAPPSVGATEPGAPIALIAYCELNERNLSLMRATHRTPGNETYRKVVTDPNTTCIDVRLSGDTGPVPALYGRQMKPFRLPSGVCIAYNVAYDRTGEAVFFWAPAEGCHRKI